MISGKNPQAKEINQKQGPRNGNSGNATKRREFMEEKDTRSSEKSSLARMVTDALEMRGRGVHRPKDDPALEGIKADVNVGRGPTKGNAGKTARRGALGATSGY